MSKSKSNKETDLLSDSKEGVKELPKEKQELNEGQKIAVLGRKRSGMTHEEAVAFVLAKKPQVGRSAKALALRAQYPNKFKGKKEQDNPSDKKLAYLNGLKKNQED